MPAPLKLGPHLVDPPVVLAPMAGVTNAAYRTLCREQGAGLYVCEMITSRGLVEQDETTLSMLVFDPDEAVRSVQLYGVDPATVARCHPDPLRRLWRRAHRPELRLPGAEGDAQGRGSGAALEAAAAARDPRQTVAAAAPYSVPVTMKTRKGIDDDHLTFLEAGEIAQDSRLRGDRPARPYRRAALLRPGGLDAIAELAAHVDIPVLGNGDIWEASDALRMMEADRVRRRGRRPRLSRPAVAVPRPGGGLRRCPRPAICRRSARWPR